MKKLQIKLTKKKPHKVYKTNIEADYHAFELCKFLRNHKDRVLEIVINDKRVKFDSIAGRKRFASGFETASKIIYEHVVDFATTTHAKINSLTSELDAERKRISDKTDYRVKHTVLNLRAAAWEDRVAELEEDRAVLKEQIRKLRKR